MMRRNLFVLLAIFSLFSVHAEEKRIARTADLGTVRSSWTTVCGGSVVAPPVETDYGFAVFTDGRMIWGSSAKGTILWQKGIRGKVSPYMAAYRDFLYVITDAKKLNLVNPSGTTLWTVDLGFDATETPLVGRDGRVFVRGRGTLACYGLNGVRKWMLDTEKAMPGIPLLTFNDGTLLAVSSELKNGKSTGVRISPFGDLLENITFTGKIITAVSCDYGILISQDDQTIALCSTENGSAVSKWVANSLVKANFIRICPAKTGKTAAFFSQKKSRAETVIVDITTGKKINQFSAGELKLSETSFLRSTEIGWYISDEKYATEFTEDGTVIWIATLPKKNKWDYIFYTEENNVVICSKDWSMRGYLMNQTVTKKTQPKKNDSSYISFSSVSTSTASSLNVERLSVESLAEISRAFDTGDYGTKERIWLNSLKNESQTLLWDYNSLLQSSHDGLSYFTANPVYTQSLITTLAKTGTNSFSKDFADILLAEKDPARLALAIQQAGKEAYDADGEMLSALATIGQTKLTPRDTSSLRLLCDATYEICRFMGKPALLKQGKDILSYLFYPQFDKGTRDYARQTLTKIMNLEL